MNASEGRRGHSRWWWWGLVLLVALSGRAALAEDTGPYPNHPVRLIVPFGPGSGGDFLARLVGAKLGQALGQAVVVENRPGASGNLAMELAAKAAPDGYTLLQGTSAGMVVSPALGTKHEHARPIR